MSTISPRLADLLFRYSSEAAFAEIRANNAEFLRNHKSHEETLALARRYPEFSNVVTLEKKYLDGCEKDADAGNGELWEIHELLKITRPDLASKFFTSIYRRDKLTDLERADSVASIHQKLLATGPDKADGPGEIDEKSVLGNVYACPQCKAVIEEKYRTLGNFTCLSCGEQQFDSGLRFGAVYGPDGTPPKIIRLHAAIWRQIPPNAIHPAAENPQQPAPNSGTFPGLDPAQFRHGPDYRECTWNGERYTFTTAQTACVQALWEEREKGNLELSQEYLLDKAGADSQQLKDIFKTNTAWRKMIVKGSKKDLFRLADPT